MAVAAGVSLFATSSSDRPSRELLVRFVISGGLGTLGGLGVYELTYALIGDRQYRATTAWIIAYVIGIFVQHALHRWITFGTEAPYWRTLRRTYVVYPIVLAISSGFNYLLTGPLDWNHRLAWLATTALSAVLSFGGLKLFAFATDQSDDSSEPASRRTT